MENDNEKEGVDSTTDPKNVVFVRGFLVRFVLGALPISLLAVVLPNLRSAMTLVFAWFFVVCIIGAGLDVKFGRKVAFDPRPAAARSRSRPPRRSGRRVRWLRRAEANSPVRVSLFPVRGRAGS